MGQSLVVAIDHFSIMDLSFLVTGAAWAMALFSLVDLRVPKQKW